MLEPHSPQVYVLEDLAPSQRAAAVRLVETVGRADGTDAMSEQARIVLRRNAPQPVTHFLLYAGTDLAGYGQLDHSGSATSPSAELIVRPDRRGRGYGRALGLSMRERCAGGLRIWAHGGRPPAQRLADRLGLTLTRELIQLRCPSSELKLQELPAPPGVAIRTFEPGADDEKWLRVNSSAFRHHPEQGLITRLDLDARKAEPWFDPQGFFLAVRGTEIIGFAWSKLHDQGRLGEGYAAGVVPSERGRGTGTLLYGVMFRHLALTAGVRTLMGHVDSDNATALLLCERLGLRRHGSDLMYSAPPT